MTLATPNKTTRAASVTERKPAQQFERQPQMTELNSPGHAVEEWRTVPTLQHIEASSLGRVRYVGPKRRKIDTGHVFPQRNDKDGYKLTNVPVFADGASAHYKPIQVHRLVTLAFHGLPPEWAELVEHRDDCKANNTPDNLFWSTHKANLNRPDFIAKQRARRHPPEVRAKISAAQRARLQTPEARAKQSAAKRGENHPMFGRQHSPETRAKISAAAARRRLQAATTRTAVEPIFSRETVAATSGPGGPQTLEIGVHRLPGNAAHA